MIPNNAAQAAINARSRATEGSSSEAFRVGRDPARAARIIGMAKNAPTHHVATIPHPMPSNVGDWVGKRGGWKTVKYSMQIRAVTWSWTIPYSTAARTLAAAILMASILRNDFNWMRCPVSAHHCQRFRASILAPTPGSEPAICLHLDALIPVIEHTHSIFFEFRKPEQTDSSGLPWESTMTRRWRLWRSRPSIFGLLRCGQGIAGCLSILSCSPPELTSPAGGIICPRNGVAARDATHSVPACVSASVFANNVSSSKSR